MANYRTHRKAMYRRDDEKISQPLKWLVAIIVFIAALGITFAEVEGAALPGNAQAPSTTVTTSQ